MIGGGTLDARGLGLLLLLGVLWGATFPIARLGIHAGAHPFLLVTIVLLFASAVTAVAAATGRARRPASRDVLSSMGLGAGMIGGANLALYWGEQYATGGMAAIVFATAPLLSTVTALLLRTAVGIRPLQAAGLGLGLLGVIVLAVPSAGALVVSSAWGIGVLLVGAAAQGAGSVYVTRWRPKGVDRWSLSFLFAGGGLAAICFLPLAASSLRLPLGTPTVFSIFYVALVAGALGWTIFLSIVHRSGAVHANLVTYLSPVVALALGVAVFDEPLQALELVGLVMILTGLLLIQRKPGPAPPRGAASVRRPTSPA